MDKGNNHKISNSKAGNKVYSWLLSLGPGLITAALVFGPSKITITSKMGADYGSSLLWVVVVAIVFMLVFTRMSARIGKSSKLSLLTLIKQKFGNKIAVLIGIGIFLVTASFQAGNSIGVGIAVAEATATNPIWWIILFNLLGISLLFFNSFYKVLEKLMIVLIAMMLFSFLTTLLMVKPNVAETLRGFIPTLPDKSITLIIAFIASCFSIVGAFYQCYLVQERTKLIGKVADNENSSNKSTVGIIILGVMGAIVMVCSATVLQPIGVKVSSASEMAKILEPLFGSYASTLFFIGLFGASFSSLVGNATVGGTLLGDALGYKDGLNSTPIKLFIALVMIVGASIAIIFGKLPLQLIILAQSITIFLVPFIGVSLYLIANDEKIMGRLKNNTFSKLMGLLGLVLLVGLAISSLLSIIG